MDKLTKRLFFALWPEDSCRAELAIAIRQLQAKASARWVKLENLHMTLAFLGEVGSEHLAELAAVAEKVEPHRLELSLDKIEYWRTPRVICLTSATTSPMLSQLAAELARHLSEAGYALEKRPYRAHLTIARKAAYLPLDARLDNPIAWKSSGFVLVESTRNAGGSAYLPLNSWPSSK